MSASARRLRWGILSTGRIVEDVVAAFGEVDRAELQALASRDPRRAREYASKWNIPTAHGSYEELLANPDIDCVYVPLPNALHGEWTRRALESGKHVLCEKPLTPTADEARALFKVADDRGLLLMEAFMYRHHPKTKQLKALLDDGAIGQPRVLRSWFHFTVADPANDIRYDAELAGGALHDVGCYCISLATYLARAHPETVAASARITDSGVDETLAATMRFGDPSNMVTVFDCGMSSALDFGAELLGREGSVSVASPWYAHYEPLSVELKVDGQHTVIATPGGNAYSMELANFCAAASGEARPEISPEETLRNLEAMERVLAAAMSNEAVSA